MTTMLLNEEQRLLRDSAQEFLAARSPVSALRRLRDTRDALGFAPELWAEMTEMGWPASVFPEAYGGLDFGYKGLGAIFEQMGRTLTASPLFATVVLGGGILLEAGSEAQRSEWLPRIVAGDARFALAVDEKPRHDPRAIATKAWRTDAGGWCLEGEKWFVLDGHVATRLIVVARTAGQPGDVRGISLFLVDPSAGGVSVERTHMVDSRNAARVRLRDVHVGEDALIGVADGGFAALDAVLDRARICLAAETLGVIRETFDQTIAYLKQRVQFGVPIGSFQALQHRAARLYAEIELLQSCVAAALSAVDEGSGDVAQLASLAKARAADLGERVLNEGVQMHGGIGVTDELDLGLFLKRARAMQGTFGDGVFHRARYAALRGF
ncbi:Flavoprotein desaturase PigA [Pandoraea terrae]|uniref:Flavoprotein desaturase PigA n=1 Tax=Pandoraea terrae TaxID=1537710 RepID=A0A5E4YX77_9BURK|nr:acyl-CoA dehydrogenase [Pandoraea terrae]VVE52493.1 Flavoprotein desaturase PigA [Pandoraea terrae]